MTSMVFVFRASITCKSTQTLSYSWCLLIVVSKVYNAELSSGFAWNACRREFLSRWYDTPNVLYIACTYSKETHFKSFLSTTFSYKSLCYDNDIDTQTSLSIRKKSLRNLELRTRNVRARLRSWYRQYICRVICVYNMCAIINCLYDIMVTILSCHSWIYSSYCCEFNGHWWMTRPTTIYVSYWIESRSWNLRHFPRRYQIFLITGLRRCE